MPESTVLVTGANGDIGGAIVRTLLREGSRVIAVDLHDRPHESFAGHPRLKYMAGDVSRANDCERIVLENTGITAYVGNAGIVTAQPAFDVDDETLRQHLEVNTIGNLRLARLLARRWREDSVSGVVVFTGSWVGVRPWPEILSYSVSKAGLEMAARTLALEWAKFGIRVNVVAPGIVNAGLARRQAEIDAVYAERVARAIPLGWLQEPEDIADATAFMLSDKARAITGTTLLVDGGASLGAI